MTDMVAADLWDGPFDEADALLQRPCDPEAERIVLGSVMERPTLIDALTAVIDPGDFHDERMAWVWHAVAALREEITDGPIGPLAVDQRLQAWRAAGRLPVLPLRIDALSQIYEGSAMAASADYYAKIVAEKAAARRLVDLGIRAQMAGRAADFDPSVTLAAVQSELDGVVREEARGKPPALAEILPGVLEQAVTPRTREGRVPTGLADLDSLTGGWAPGRMVVIGARPSVGKTTMGLVHARAAAIAAGLPTLLVSLEMSQEEIGHNILAAEAGVGAHLIRDGLCTAADVRRLALAQERIATAPLRVDDTPHVTLAHLRHQVRTLQRAEGLRLLIVDYLQLMQAPKAENRQVAVSNLSRGLKLLAKEFNIPVIVLSQLNRGSEMRVDKRPMSSDLRESGSLEQDADIVILLHREDMREPDSPRAGELDVIVDKHRAGHRATITCAAQMHYARVVDMAGTWETEPSEVAP
ncbi:replicative DNA helicase [Streptomyces sp. 4N509B]|uniref:replicative DNA helicase n=1 Tax=Streptomyces sp. 4N509B TaxID=3457413 RepID=UPI003FD58076